MVPISFYLSLSMLMFLIGAIGVIVRRNAIIVFMCIELMLNAANVALVALSKATGNLDGQIGVFFVMVVAAAEAAVGLAIFISLFRARKTIETSEASELRF